MGDEVDDQARQMDEQARDKQSSRHDLLQPSSSPKRTSKRTTVLQHLTRSLQDTAVVTRKWSANKPPMFGRSKFQAIWIFLHPIPRYPLPLTPFTSYPLSSSSLVTRRAYLPR